MLPSEVIRIIRAAGGIPVLAHPIFLNRDALIDQFALEGLLGLEVHHSSHTPDLVQRYEAIAKRLNLLQTGGSDYHGTTKEGVPIGVTKVPVAFVDALKRWKATVTSA
jgi:predicted metal-dependent phosphoesterase TrpH